jgi:RecB family exonuclease
MPDVHLKYGGSTATRTLNCPAWVGLAEKLPKVDRTSAAADRGTKLHNVMERIYADGLAVDEALAEAIAAGNMVEDDADAIHSAYAATEEYLNGIEAVDLVCEELVTLADNIGGSADMLACSGSIGAVIDYKFGYMPVTETDQFSLYAIAARSTPSVADMFEGKEVESVIIQPEVSGHPIVHQHSPAQLADFQNRFLLAVERAEAGGCEPCPGDWCKYCPAAPTCPAKKTQVANFLNYDPKQQQQVADAMNLVDQMKQQIKAIEAEVFANLEDGRPVPGWKLVAKRGTRKWTDEAAVLHKLRYSAKVTKGQYITESLKSPAQVEKATKNVVDLTEWTSSDSTGNTIAPESDKREAIITRGAGIPENLGAIIGGKKG